MPDTEQLATAHSFRQHSPKLKDFISITGLASLGVGAVLWLTSSHIGHKSGDLDRAHHITKLSDLQGLVHLLPALVAIRGRVGSHSPKRCELSDKLAVIHEVLEEEVWRKQRAEGRTVYEPFETRKVFEECEWYLEDGQGPRVRAENALHAERLRSALESQAEFVPEDIGNKTIGKVILEKAWAAAVANAAMSVIPARPNQHSETQMSKHGQRKTERYLPVGAVITAVGELDHNYIHKQAPTLTGIDSNYAAATSAAALPTDNSSSHAGGGILGKLPTLWRGQGSLSEDMPYVLRKPTSGPSYITPLTLDQLKASLSITARNCRWLAMAFGAVGAALLLQKAVTRILQRAHERRIRLRVAQAEAARKARAAEARKARQLALQTGNSTTGSGNLTLDVGGDDDGYVGDRAAGTCVICLEEPVDMVFTSCGHMCCCMGCGIALDRCPICRIKGRAIKVFKP